MHKKSYATLPSEPVRNGEGEQPQTEEEDDDG